MRTTVTLSCPQCGTSWDAPVARFCGRCGAVLDAPAPSAATRGRRRRVTTAVLVAGVLVAAPLALAVSGPLLGATWSRSDPEVALPAPDLVPRNTPPTAEERAEVLAPFDERRLRCEPVGCELWRLEPGAVRGAWGHEDGSVVVLAGDSELISLDPRTGHPLWRAPAYGPDGKGEGGPPSPGGPHPDHVAIGDDVVVVFDQGHTRAHDRATGEVHWSVTTAGEVWWGSIIEGTVIAVGGTPTGAVWTDQVTALDVTDGSVRWTGEASGAFPTNHGVVVHEDGEIVVRDLETGEAVVALPHEDDTWLDALGPWLVRVAEHDGTVLLDPASGAEVIHLDGSPTYGAVEAGGHWILLMAEDLEESPGMAPDDVAPGDETPGLGGIGTGPDVVLEVVALTPDGEVVWRHPFATVPAWDCCPGIVSWLDGTVLVHAGAPAASWRDAPPVVLDAATGTTRDDVVVARPPADSWAVAPGVWVVDDAMGDRIDLHTPEGSVTVTGRGPWVVQHDPLIVQDQHTMMGVQVPAEP